MANLAQQRSMAYIAKERRLAEQESARLYELAQRKAKILEQHRITIIPHGTAGVAAAQVLSIAAMLQTISSYMIMSDLNVFRQCSHATCRAVTTYVRAPADNGGMAARFWERMEREPNVRPWIKTIQKFQADVAAAGCQSYVTGSTVMGMLSGDNWKSNDIDIVCEGNAATLHAVRQLFETLGIGANKHIRNLEVHNSLHAERTQTGHVHTSNTIDDHTTAQSTTTAPTSTPSSSPPTAAVSSSLASHEPLWMSTTWPRYHRRGRSSKWSQRHHERFMSKHDHPPAVIAPAKDDSEPAANATTGDDDDDDDTQVISSWASPELTHPSSTTITAAMNEAYPTAYELHIQAWQIMRGVPVIERQYATNEDDYAKHSRSIYYSMNLYMTCDCKLSPCKCPEVMRMDVLFLPGNDCIAAGGLFGWMDRNCDIDLTVNGISPAGLRCYAPHHFENRDMFFRTDTYCQILNPINGLLIENPDRPSPVVGPRRRINCNCPRIQGRIFKYQERGFTVTWLSYADYEEYERNLQSNRRASLRDASFQPLLVVTPSLQPPPDGASNYHPRHYELPAHIQSTGCKCRRCSHPHRPIIVVMTDRVNSIIDIYRDLLATQRRYNGMTLRGVAGAATAQVMITANLLHAISSHMLLSDLNVFRQCSQATCKAVTTYVRAPATHGGMAARFWEKLQRDSRVAPVVLQGVKQFQADVAAAGAQSFITGSSVMSVLIGDTHWSSNDIDIVCDGTAATITAFAAMLTRFGDRVANIAIHESLHAERPIVDHIMVTEKKWKRPGLPLATAPLVYGMRKPSSLYKYDVCERYLTVSDSMWEDQEDWQQDDDHTLDKIAARPSPAATWPSLSSSSSSSEKHSGKSSDTALERATEQAMAQASPTASELQLIVWKMINEFKSTKVQCRYDSGDYAKHSRSVYFSMDVYPVCACKTKTKGVCTCKSDMRMDVLFIAANDSIMSGGLFGWMDRNCDVDLTVNGIGHNGLRVYAPHYFAERTMYFRCDQYCKIPYDAHLSLKENPRPMPTGGRKRIRCNCPRIVGRITKYQDRGFYVKWLSYAEYQQNELDRMRDIRQECYQQQRTAKRLNANHTTTTTTSISNATTTTGTGTGSTTKLISNTSKAVAAIASTVASSSLSSSSSSSVSSKSKGNTRDSEIVRRDAAAATTKRSYAAAAGSRR